MSRNRLTCLKDNYNNEVDAYDGTAPHNQAPKIEHRYMLVSMLRSEGTCPGVFGFDNGATASEGGQHMRVKGVILLQQVFLLTHNRIQEDVFNCNAWSHSQDKHKG